MITATMERMPYRNGRFDERFRLTVRDRDVTVVGRKVVFEACRELVAAGVPDQPMEVLGPDGVVAMTVPSIHRGAKVTAADVQGRATFSKWVPFTGCHFAEGRVANNEAPDDEG